MDHESLRTASTYLHNLLLARGLLRHGEPIDFVKPSKESRAQIINLVHDLILREDRDKEQREQVAHTLRTLRAEDERKTREIERLVAKSDESARATVQAQAAERTASAELKKGEKTTKTLQAQIMKLKTSLAQVKAQCTNDVRKRDLEITRLKTHLQGQQRGSRAGMTAPSMIVKKPTAQQPTVRDLGDPEYTLKQETNEFLTELSQSLSNENDSLIALIRSTLDTLKELLELPINNLKHPDSAMGSMHSGDEHHSKRQHTGHGVRALPTSYEALAADMESTLSHLKPILTNPNFVSMEEVEVREEEIERLREGWQHMEHRWKDVVYMMQDWLNRMDTGDTINIEDLRKGMGLVSPDRDHSRGRHPTVEHSIVESDASEIQLPGSDDSGAMTLSPPLPITRPRGSPKRKRDALEPPEFFDLRPRNVRVPTSASRVQESAEDAVQLSHPRDSASMAADDDDESEELEPPMTITEKLNAIQQEADETAAAKAAGVDAADGTASQRRSRDPSGSIDELALGSRDDTLGKMPSPMGKKSNIRGRPKKRKSTLTPDEFASLLEL